MIPRALRIAPALAAALAFGALAQTKDAGQAGTAPAENPASRSAQGSKPAAAATGDKAAAKPSATQPAPLPAASDKSAAAPAATAPAAPAGDKAAGDKGSVKGVEGNTTAVAIAPGAEGQRGDDNFELKVKNLEESVNDLKEKIFRTKARLLLLQETVLGGDITSGAKAVLVHRNEMGNSYTLEQASYALDGAPIFTRVDSEGDLDKKQEIEIFNGRIVPGNHQVSVKLQYRGHGFGVFSYIEGYKFKVQSSYTFNAEGGKVTEVKVIGYEKGNITTDLKDRPAVKYDVEVTRDAAHRDAQAEAQKPAGGDKP